ncbi:M20 metallopeptidase family protein [Methanofollis fontis]|uniref:M20 metallopeptidase family protein n=1 Tax=Methanofollis fontis TaxID=2052832 RepID=UPI0013EE4932|nr:amidohydrolase [Methanofollis fontis]
MQTPIRPPSAERLIETIREELPSLVSLYRDLHARPELSGEEEETADRLAQELREAGCTVTTGIGGHGVVGVLLNGPGPVMMIRADMDALPLNEETGLAYASRHPGVMHACGHDINMAALVGAVRALATLRESWSGTLLCVGQPAEETGSGAREMIQDGLFTRFPRPDGAVAVHVGPDIPDGMVASRSGILSAGSETIDLTVRGVGGHAAHPDQTRDPIVLAAGIIMAIQTIRSREIDPNAFFILSAGQIHGGRKHNAIPDEVTLGMSLRYHKAAVRDQGLAALRRIAEGTAIAAGVPADRLPLVRVLDQSVPPLITDPDLTARCSDAAARYLGPEQVATIPVISGSEDFSVFAEEGIPLAYFRIGTAPADGSGEFLHSPRFAPPAESAILTGAIVLAAAVIAGDVEQG